MIPKLRKLVWKVFSRSWISAVTATWAWPYKEGRRLRGSSRYAIVPGARTPEKPWLPHISGQLAMALGFLDLSYLSPSLRSA